MPRSLRLLGDANFDIIVFLSRIQSIIGSCYYGMIVTIVLRYIDDTIAWRRVLAKVCNIEVGYSSSRAKAQVMHAFRHSENRLHNVTSCALIHFRLIYGVSGEIIVSPTWSALLYQLT